PMTAQIDARGGRVTAKAIRTVRVEGGQVDHRARKLSILAIQYGNTRREREFRCEAGEHVRIESVDTRRCRICGDVEVAYRGHHLLVRVVVIETGDVGAEDPGR